MSIPRYLQTRTASTHGLSCVTFHEVPDDPDVSITVFLTANFMSIPCQKLFIHFNILSMSLGLVLEINTRLSAKNKADSICPSNLTPSFIACRTVPRPDMYKVNSSGESTHPCLTPLVNQRGAGRLPAMRTLTQSL